MRLPLVLIFAAAALFTDDTSGTLNSNSPSANALNIDDEERALIPTNLRQGMETVSSKANWAKAAWKKLDPAVKMERKRIFRQYRQYINENHLLSSDNMEQILNHPGLYDSMMDFNQGVSENSPRVWNFVFSIFENDRELLYAILLAADRSRKDPSKAADKLTDLVVKRYKPKSWDRWKLIELKSNEQERDQFLKRVLKVDE